MNRAAVVMHRRHKVIESYLNPDDGEAVKSLVNNSMREVFSVVAAMLVTDILEGLGLELENDDTVGCDFQSSYIKLGEVWFCEYYLKYLREEGEEDA